MVAFDWQHDIPRRRDDPAWRTFSETRFVVLVVARTLTSAYRLLEAVHWFRDDFRIELLFTVDATSAFSSGVFELLRKAEVAHVDWKQVQHRAFDYHLVLSASENIDFDSLTAHTVLLPHGLGFNKFVPSGHDGQRRLAGLPPRKALLSGAVTIAVSHPEQRRQLLAANPDTKGRTRVVGDATFDRLLISRALRDRYREAFDTGDRTLATIVDTRNAGRFFNFAATARKATGKPAHWPTSSARASGSWVTREPTASVSKRVPAATSNGSSQWAAAP